MSRRHGCAVARNHTTTDFLFWFLLFDIFIKKLIRKDTKFQEFFNVAYEGKNYFCPQLEMI